MFVFARLPDEDADLARALKESEEMARREYERDEQILAAQQRLQ